MGTWTRPNNRSSVVIDGMTFNIGDLMGAGLDPFDNLSSRAVMDALARHNQAKNIFNLNPLFLGTRPEDTYQEEVVDLNADTTASDLLSTIDPSLASVAANTGPFVTDPAAGTDTLVAGGDSDTVADDKETGVSSETAEQILAKYKDRADPVTDMLGDYKQEDGLIFPVNVLLEIISDYAINRNNKDAQIVLGKWNDKVAARKEDILDADAAANNQAAAEAAAARNQAGADAAAQQTSDGNTDTGLKADNAAGGAATAGGAGAGGNVPAGGASGGAGGGASGGAGGGAAGGAGANGAGGLGGGIDDKKKTVDPKKDDTGIGLPPINDQPPGLLNIPTTVSQQPEKKAGMIMQISQSAPIVETVLDDYLYPPMFRELNNVKQSPFPTALLFSNGLMGSFV